MSSRNAHIRQAQHNEALVRELVGDGYRYRDWAVIAIFYAAVHYFEARLHDAPAFTHPEAVIPITHSENSVPKIGPANRYSPHIWREKLLESNCGWDTLRAYRRLRSTSETARYHSHINRPIRSAAHYYFSPGEVDSLLSVELEIVKSSLGFS